jgi:hypothetical protein
MDLEGEMIYVACSRKDLGRSSSYYTGISEDRLKKPAKYEYLMPSEDSKRVLPTQFRDAFCCSAVKIGTHLES